jgi:HEAT repeat protein
LTRFCQRAFDRAEPAWGGTLKEGGFFLDKGLKTTFRVLSQTQNVAAVRVLLLGLDSPDAAIREGALRALLVRRDLAGHREIVRRWDRLDDATRQIVDAHRDRLTHAVRDAVLSTDRRLAVNGCSAAVRFREYDLIPALVNALEAPSNPEVELTGATLLALVGALGAELGSPVQDHLRRDPDLVRQHAVAVLERSVDRYAKHRRREVLEAFLLLVRRDHEGLGRFLRDAHHPAHLPLFDLLSKSTAPGVMELLLSFLDDPGAPLGVLSLAAKRTDPEFLGGLFRKIADRPGRVLQQNVKRIESLAWLEEEPWLVEALDGACQQAALWLVMHSAVPRTQAFKMVRRLLLYGAREGRRAAAEALNDFYGAEANALVEMALNDPDAEVQAKAAAQLRGRGICGSLTRLVDLVDSPHPMVREAARASLAEFTFDRFLVAFDGLDDHVRRSTGALVGKVDRETIPRLRAELTSRIVSRRARALAIAEAIDVVEPLEDVIVGLLETDHDEGVRARAAYTLGFATSPRSRGALERALDDFSPDVQEAAAESLCLRVAGAPFHAPDVPLESRETPR